MSSSSSFVFLLQAQNCESEPQVVFLLNPASGEKEKYFYSEQHFLEISKTESQPSSWFANNQVIQDGSLHLATRIHPLFLCIPFLRQCDSSKFLPLGDIFTPAQVEHAPLLASNETVKKTLPLVCEVKQLGEDCYYKFDQEKCIQWLKGRVVKAEEGIRALWEKKNSGKDSQGVKILCHIEAVRLVCRVLSDDLQTALLKALNISAASMEPKKDELEKWGFQVKDSSPAQNEAQAEAEMSASKRAKVSKGGKKAVVDKSQKSIGLFFKKKA